jgi:photosystem II stability/assembly factor-like uncharacterized protein
MKTRKIFFIILILFFISGCTISFSTKKSENGGVYLSFDKGNKWQPASFLLKTSSETENFQSLNIKFLLMDPTDNQALYAGTDSGLFYTYNATGGWQRTLAGIGSVSALAIDPNNKCILYSAINNRLYKSIDCNRHWNYTLIEDSTADLTITAIAVDNYNSENIFVGTVKGGLFKSEDSGNSWRNLKYFSNAIKKIIITPSDTKIMYVVTQSKGIFRTDDAGTNWTEITNNIQIAMDNNEIDKNCENFREYRNVIFDPNNDSRLLYASRCLFESSDRGDTWKQIRLLTRPQETNIYGLAISYHDNKEIYYGTNTTFYKTFDNGENWATKDLPTTRSATNIITDPINPTLIYLGTNNFK